MRYIISYKLLQIVNLAHLASPLSKNALIRRNLWNSEAEAHKYFSSKPLFKNISEKIGVSVSLSKKLTEDLLEILSNKIKDNKKSL